MATSRALAACCGTAAEGERHDGIAAGIFGVVSVLVAADLMRGTGRFNLAQGLLALCVGIGAGLSNVLGEHAVPWFGTAAGFLTLAGVALCALLFFALLMPKTQARADAEVPA